MPPENSVRAVNISQAAECGVLGTVLSPLWFKACGCLIRLLNSWVLNPSEISLAQFMASVKSAGWNFFHSIISVLHLSQPVSGLMILRA
jgi:hypothetical protein